MYVPLASAKRAYDCGWFEMYLDQAASSMMVDRRFRRYESDLSATIADELGPGPIGSVVSSVRRTLEPCVLGMDHYPESSPQKWAGGS